MKILTLTDHSNHSLENSLYSILNAFSRNKEIHSVSLATRGDIRNADFFNGKIKSNLYGITLKNEVSFPIDRLLKKATLLDLDIFDVVFLRVPRPIENSMLLSLYDLLGNKLIVNDPNGIVQTSNKSFLLELENYVVPMNLAHSANDLMKFLALYDLVLKPLENYGGKGVIKIAESIVESSEWKLPFEEFIEDKSKFRPPYLAMKYLHNVTMGDKRIFVAGGKILFSALRFPKTGGWLCNVAQGGKTAMSIHTEREQKIVNYLSPILRAKGIFYYGLDTLTDDNGKRVISEINTLSIGGIGPAENSVGHNLTDRFTCLFIKYCNQWIKNT